MSIQPAASEQPGSPIILVFLPQCRYPFPRTGFVQKWLWFSMIFQDKTTLFSKLFKVFYTCLC